MGETTTITREQLPEFLKANVGPIVAELVEDSQKKFADELKNEVVGEINKSRDSLLADIVSKSRGNAPAKKLEEDQKGIPFARVVRALAASGGDWDEAARIAKDQYSKDYATELAVECLENKAFKAGSSVNKQLAAGDFTAGGALTFSTVSSDFIGLLRNRTAVRQLGPRVIPMPTGSVTLMEQTGGATAEWLGENTSQNASQADRQETPRDRSRVERPSALGRSSG